MKNLLGQAFINNSIDVIIIIYFLNLPSLISRFFFLIKVQFIIIYLSIINTKANMMMFTICSNLVTQLFHQMCLVG